MNRMNKDHIRSLERIQYEGDIEIVSDRDQLKRILDQLSRFEMIGFDTESKPVFEKGVQSRLAIIQLASHDTVYLVQVLKTGFTDGLKSFLTQDSPLKLGIGLLDDLRKLRAEIDTELNGFIDLSSLASKKGIIQIGIQALVARYINRYISKRQQRSNWENDVLSKQQQVYAATDAWICLKLYPELIADETDYRQFKEE